jgi:hypothetical protein
MRKNTMILLGQITILSAKRLIGKNDMFQVTAIMIIFNAHIKVIKHTSSLPGDG